MHWRPVAAVDVDRVLSMDAVAFFDWIDHDHGAGFDVDKAWHGIHAALTGSAWDADHELGAAVLGGEEFGEDGGYGPPRLLRPAEVAAVAGLLEAIEPDAFAARVDLAALAAGDVYPGIWDEGDEAVEYLVAGYGRLRAGYLAAAAAGQAMVILLS